MTMLALAAAFASGAASAANYYRMAAEDPSGTSSFSGHKNGSTNPTGWSANPDGTGSLVYSVTSGNAYFFPTNTSRKIRTPTTTTSWAMPADSYLTVQRGATMQVDMKFQSSSTLTLHSLHLEENAGALFVPANGVAEEVDTIAGEISMSDGSSLYLRSINATRNGFTANITHVLSATVAGRGEVCTYPQESAYDPATITATFGRTERITGDLSGFCGNIVCFGHASVAAAVNLELVNVVSIPANPPSGETAYVVVTNGATLTVDQDWKSGSNRVWDFGSGATPSIYVAAGKAVTIYGEVRGSVGFKKTGPGTLVLVHPSPSLSGVCVVADGKVVLRGGAVGLKRLFRRLPVGYTEREFVKGPGASCRIVTDYIPQPNRDRIEALVEWPKGSLTKSMAIWCARYNGNDRTWTLFALTNVADEDIRFRFDYGSVAGTRLTPAIVEDVKYSVVVASNVFSFVSSAGSGGQTHSKAADFTPGRQRVAEQGPHLNDLVPHVVIYHPLGQNLDGVDIILVEFAECLVIALKRIHDCAVPVTLKPLLVPVHLGDETVEGPVGIKVHETAGGLVVQYPVQVHVIAVQFPVRQVHVTRVVEPEPPVNLPEPVIESGAH